MVDKIKYTIYLYIVAEKMGRVVINMREVLSARRIFHEFFFEKLNLHFTLLLLDSPATPASPG